MSATTISPFRTSPRDQHTSEAWFQVSFLEPWLPFAEIGRYSLSNWTFSCIKVCSHLPRGLRHFEDSNSIPWNQPTIFHPSLIATICSRRPFLNSAYRSLSNPILSRIDGVLTYNDSMTILHKHCQIPTTELPNLVLQQRIDDDSHPSRRTLWSAVIKSPKFSALGTTVPVRLLQGALVILVRKQISQFLSLGKLVLRMCFLDTNLARWSESESWEVFASAGTCVSSHLSVISSKHSRGSQAIFFCLFVIFISAFWIIASISRRLFVTSFLE